jgi:hypothetical protein
MVHFDAAMCEKIEREVCKAGGIFTYFVKLSLNYSQV